MSASQGDCSDQAAAPNIFNYTRFSGLPYTGCTFRENAVEEWQELGGLGWFIVIGLAGVFSFCTPAVMWARSRTRERETGWSAEKRFIASGHSIKPFFLACILLNKWTWPIDLVLSSHFGFKFGVAGAFWYSASAAVPFILFSIVALHVKCHFPRARSVLDIILVRYGPNAHLVFLCFCLGANWIVSCMMALAAAVVVSSVLGTNLGSTAVLLPLGVAFYTAHGGLMASYIGAWFHVLVVLGISLFFTFQTFYGNDDLASPKALFDNLVEMAAVKPVDGNKDGSYLTLWSRDGTLLGIANLVCCLGYVMVDQSYWQASLAARGSDRGTGFLLAGFAWFSIPFAAAMSLGLGARAMDLPISDKEAEQGLVPAAVATHLLGTAGSVLVALQVFLSLMGSQCSQLVAGSSIISFNLYKQYIDPSADGKRLIRIARGAVFLQAVLAGVGALTLHLTGVTLASIFSASGVFTGSAVVPMAGSIVSNRMSSTGAISGATFGLLMGLVGWVLAARLHSGGLQREHFGQPFPLVVGSLASIGTSTLVSVVVSLVAPDDFSWTAWRASYGAAWVPASDATDGPLSAAISRRLSQSSVWGGAMAVPPSMFREASLVMFRETSALSTMQSQSRQSSSAEVDPERVATAATADSNEWVDVDVSWTPIIASLLLALAIVVAWPLLSLLKQTMNFSMFNAFVMICLGWLLACAVLVLLLPLFEARNIFFRFFGIIPPKPLSKLAKTKLKAEEVFTHAEQTLVLEIESRGQGKGEEENPGCVQRWWRAVFNCVIAGRQIKDERNFRTRSEEHQWNARTTTCFLVGVVTSVFNLVLVAIFAAAQAWGMVIISGTYSVLVLLGMVVLRVINVTKAMSLNHSIVAYRWFQIILFLIVPTVSHVLLGGVRRSGGCLVWTLMAPFATLSFIGDSHFREADLDTHEWPANHLVRQKRVRIILLARTLLVMLLICLNDSLPVDRFEIPSWLETVLWVLNDAICPVVIVYSSRLAMLDFLDRRARVLRFRKALDEKNTVVQQLINSVIPEFRVRSLTEEERKNPAAWHRADSIVFPGSTTIQMDIVGFTAMSSQVPVTALIEMLNDIFSQIDEAAKCIGNVWKVETIGDCYIGVAGGPHEDPDHAEKGIVLGLCILSLVEHLKHTTNFSAAHDVEIAARVGIHTGWIKAAAVGTVMPRYLIFGQNCQVVHRLESSGVVGGLHISDATAKEISKRWQSEPHTTINLPNGQTIQTFAILLNEHNRTALMQEAGRYEGLGLFLKRFAGGDLSQLRVPRSPDGRRGSYSRGRRESDGNVSVASSNSGSQSDPTEGLGKGGARIAFAAGLDNGDESVLSSPSAGRGSKTRSSIGRHATKALNAISKMRTLPNRIRRRSIVKGSEHAQNLEWIHKAMELGDDENAPAEPSPWDVRQAMAAGLKMQQFMLTVFLVAAGLAAGVQATVLLAAPTWYEVECRPTRPDCWAERVDRLQYLSMAPGVFGIAAIALACMTSGAPFEERPKGLRNIAEILLFLSPGAFVGDLRDSHLRSAVLWGFTAAVLRSNFSTGIDATWARWTVFYVLGTATLHTLMTHYSEEQERESKEATGWMMVLYALNHLLPTTLFLFPLSLTARALMDDEYEGQLVLVTAAKSKARLEALLLALVPEPIVKQLCDTATRTIAKSYAEVTVMFIYLDGYEDMLFRFDLEEVIRWLNQVFGALDEVIENKDADGNTTEDSSVSKVETFHNFYMVVAGCLSHCPAHADECVIAGLEMRRKALEIRRPDGKPTLVKIGLNSGPLCGGVIGDKVPRWSIFGDTVNTASRMASTAALSATRRKCIHVSQSTRELLTDRKLQRRGLLVKERGQIDVKGKGQMRTFYIHLADLDPGDSGSELAEPQCSKGDEAAFVVDAGSRHLASMPKLVPAPPSPLSRSEQRSTSMQLGTDMEAIRAKRAAAPDIGWRSLIIADETPPDSPPGRPARGDRNGVAAAAKGEEAVPGGEGGGGEGGGREQGAERCGSSRSAPARPFAYVSSRIPLVAAPLRERKDAAAAQAVRHGHGGVEEEEEEEAARPRRALPKVARALRIATDVPWQQQGAEAEWGGSDLDLMLGDEEEAGDEVDESFQTAVDFSVRKKPPALAESESAKMQEVDSDVAKAGGARCRSPDLAWDEAQGANGRESGVAMGTRDGAPRGAQLLTRHVSKSFSRGSSSDSRESLSSMTRTSSLPTKLKAKAEAQEASWQPLMGWMDAALHQPGVLSEEEGVVSDSDSESHRALAEPAARHSVSGFRAAATSERVPAANSGSGLRAAGCDLDLLMPGGDSMMGTGNLNATFDGGAGMDPVDSQSWPTRSPDGISLDSAAAALASGQADLPPDSDVFLNPVVWEAHA